MKVLNLTQHAASSPQTDQGVYEPANKKEVQGLLTFASLPSSKEVKDVAAKLVAIAKDEGAGSAMIGGAPFLMAPLHNALKEAGVTPCYAFSVRESVEKVNEDGSVTKTAVFNHKGFVSF